MNILVTAGNTFVPIDRVRGITNVFTGKTGASIARCAWERGHHVTLLTSQPEVVGKPVFSERWAILPYYTFADLRQRMGELVTEGNLDAIIHCAAISDYLADGIFAPAPGTRFHPETGHWDSESAIGPVLVDRSADKVKSDEPELWLRLVRAPKLIDCIRSEWGFGGLLVKFKLEAGIRDEQLLAIAEPSRVHSDADFMVANTIEGAGAYAYIGPFNGKYETVLRPQLAERLLMALEQYPQKATDG